MDTHAIYCVGRNYAEHAKELGNEVPAEPVIFLKSPAALRPVAHGTTAFPAETFHHEAEIVVRVGKSVVLGASAGWGEVESLALGLDLTRREVQTKLKEKGLPWTLAKSFAGAAVVSDFIAISQFPEPDAITFEMDVNGETRQRGDSSIMLNSVPRILTFLASYQPLFVGDLIFTGTPKGVGPIRVGDEFALRFTGQVAREFRGRL